MYYAKLAPIENDKLPMMETKNLAHRAQMKYDGSVGNGSDDYDKTEATARGSLPKDELDIYYKLEVVLQCDFCGELIYGGILEKERHTTTRGNHYCNYSCMSADYCDEIPEDVEFKRK